MSLILPGSPAWAQCTSNLSGTPSLTPGTAVTASATANAVGTSVALLSALAHDTEMLCIGISTSGASGQSNNMLLDILVDPAGGTTWSSTALISNLIAGYTVTTSGVIMMAPRWYHFPIWVKSGASIGARLRAATASAACRVIAYAFGGNRNPGSWWCGQHVTDIGMSTASSSGTSHTAGNSGAFSSWTNFGSTTPAQVGAVQFQVGGGGASSMTSLQYHFEFGLASTRIGPTMYTHGGTNETMGFGYAGPIFCSIGSGKQLQVRGTCSGTAAALDVGAWVVH